MDKVKSHQHEKANSPSGLAGTAGVSRTRAFAFPPLFTIIAEDCRVLCTTTVTFAYAPLPARSCQLHNGIIGLCSLVLLPPSFLSGGPAQNVGPSVARIPRVSLLSCVRARALSLSLSLILSSRVLITETHSLTAVSSETKRRQPTRAASVDASRADENKRAKKKKKKKKKTPDEADRSNCARLYLACGAARGRPIVLTTYPPIQERTATTTIRKTQRISSRERPTDYPRRSLSVQGPGATTLRGPPKKHK